jgi:hypothetical protein
MTHTQTKEKRPASEIKFPGLVSNMSKTRYDMIPIKTKPSSILGK